MFATIWMCTHEWSLISSRATALTFATCHHALRCVSPLTRWTSVRSLRLPRAGTLIRIRATASAGVSRTSRSASSEAGDSIRSSISGSRSLTPGSLGGRRSGRRRRRERLLRRRRPGEREVGQRQRDGHERRDYGVRDHVLHEAAGLLGEPERQDRHHDVRGDRQEDRDHDHPEHVPAVAANELATPTEGLTGRAALEHDHRDDHRPDREQEEAGHDQEDETEDDPEPGEQAGRDDRGQPGPNAGERLADREVPLPVADVADGLDERALEPEEPDDREQAPDERPDQAERPREQERDQPDDHEDDERERDERLPVGLVQLPGLANDGGCLHRPPTLTVRGTSSNDSRDL